MALVIFGGGVAQMRGKLGGTVFSRNRGGSYARTFVSPVNPNTAPQQLVRSAMSALVVSWLVDLTPEQRAAWDTYAANVPMQNGLGETIFLTGQQMFIRSNSILVRLGKTRIDAAPTVFNLGHFTEVTAAGTAGSPGEVAVTFDNTDDWANEDGGFMFVQTADELNPTINFFKGPFIQAGEITGSGTTPPTSPGNVFAFADFTTGNISFIRVRAIHADGRLTSPSIVRLVIT